MNRYPQPSGIESVPAQRWDLLSGSPHWAMPCEGDASRDWPVDRGACGRRKTGRSPSHRAGVAKPAIQRHQGSTTGAWAQQLAHGLIGGAALLALVVTRWRPALHPLIPPARSDSP